MHTSFKLTVVSVVVVFLVSQIGTATLAGEPANVGHGKKAQQYKQRRQNGANASRRSAGPRAAFPLLLDNGVGGDGHFDITVDEYGSYGDFLGAGPVWHDNFDPVADPDEGELGLLQATFASDIRIFTGPTGENGGGNRVVLSTNPFLDDGYNNEASRDHFDDANGGKTLDFEIVSENSSDNLPESTSSTFRVFRDDQGINLNMALTQSVGISDPGPNGELAAFLNQTISITNNGTDDLDIRLNKHIDEDMPWGGGGTYWLDDRVGMDRAELGRPQVFAQDRELVTAALILRTLEDMTKDPRTTEFVYYAAKEGTTNPDPSDPTCPDFGEGTYQTPIWNNFGVPECYKNFVGGVGRNLSGTSPQLTGDSYIGLQLSILLPVGETYTATFQIVYGFRPVPPRFAPPKGSALLVDAADDCAEFFYEVKNLNEGGNVPADPITTLLLDVEAGTGAQNCDVEVVPPAGFTTAENCTGFDANGHAVFRMTGGTINPFESANGRIIIQANGLEAFTNPLTGITVDPLSVALSFAQDFPGMADEYEPVCEMGNFDIGPTANDGGLWSVATQPTAFLAVPSLGDWAKLTLACCVLTIGTGLVLRSRRSVATTAR